MDVKKIVRLGMLFLLMGLGCGGFAAPSKQGKVKMTEEEIRASFVECAKQYLGTPYVYRGESKSGLDCSGLVFVSARDAGLGKVPHSSQQLFDSCQEFEGEPKSGDLIFFAENGTDIYHVGIYLGDGEFIHAASAGRKTGVIVTKLSETTLKNDLAGYRALITEKTVVYKKEVKEEDKVDVKAEEPLEEVKSSKDVKTDDGNTESGSTAVSAPVPVSEKEAGGEVKENESTKPKKENVFGKAVLENCEVQGAITFDWSFIKPTDIDFFMQGISLEGALRLDRWVVNPGVLVRVKFSSNAKNIYGGVLFPVCLTLSYERFQVYGGIVGYIPNGKQNVLYGTDIKLEPQLWPGIFGAAVNFEVFNIKQAKILLYQDINYVCQKPNVANATNQQWMSGGFNMSSGLKVSF